VTFAVDKKTAYVRDAKGAERRLLVTKTTTKRKPQPYRSSLTLPGSFQFCNHNTRFWC